jgi:hypothetical protein
MDRILREREKNIEPREQVQHHNRSEGRRHIMVLEQVMELLLARMDAYQAKVDADRKADQDEWKAM